MQPVLFYKVSFSFDMAFFNLTQLGVEDSIKASVQSPKVGTSCNGRQSDVSRFTETKLPNSEANGSYEKYTTMLQKHQRLPNGKT